METMGPKGPVWWKIIVGAVLVYIEVKQIVYPGTRALRPSNPTQAASMLFVECALILLGAWLFFLVYERSRSGEKRADRRAPEFGRWCNSPDSVTGDSDTQTTTANASRCTMLQADDWDHWS